MALLSSWSAVDRSLQKWTPEQLREEVTRVRADGSKQVHTRQLILFRLITHDAVHAGEISQLLGEQVLPELDPWRKMQVR